MTAPIQLIRSGIDVVPIHWALRSHPELWNQHSGRTKSEDSPHRDVSDIWVRYAPAGVSGAEPHESIWYYPAADDLPIKDLAIPLMAAVRGVALGGILITKIPAGKSVRPHIDHGWHARFYEKFAIQVEAAPGQKFCFEEKELETKPGDLYWFDNSKSHWVTNESDYDRITAIICIKR